MKVVQCVGWYFPSSVGGSEIYVQKLSAQLAARGIDVTIMAPHADGTAKHVERYQHEGLSVVRYPVPDERTDAQRDGQLPHSLFEVFSEALQAEQAQVFHLHSVTYGCNAHHLRAARALAMRTFMTAHIPNVVCMRGTLLRMGQQPCDGRVLESQCVPCDAHFRGVPASLASLVAPLCKLVPTPVGPSRMRTLLSTPARVRALADSLRATFEDVDGIVAVCEWLRLALLANGAPAAKVLLQRQGVDIAPDRARVPRLPHSHASPALKDRPVRVGYFGRASPVKGIDTLLAAVTALPADLAIEVHVYAIAHLPEDQATLLQVKKQALRDARIRVHAAVPPSEVGALMQQHDVIAVPSRWLETGPLVAMEAIALGVPVLGSDRGGIAEIVEHGATGWLEPAGDVQRWSARLARIARGEDALDRALAKVELATSAQVAEAMIALYSS